MAFKLIHQNGFIRVIDLITNRDYFFNPRQLKLKREYLGNLFKLTDNYETVEIGTFSNCQDSEGAVFATEAAFLSYLSSLMTAETQIQALESINNSTSATLGIGATFTGLPDDVNNSAIIIVSVYSDVASATDGLKLQFSKDKINWFWDDVYTVKAGAAKTFSVQPCAKWFRIIYVNGAVAQTTFQITTSIHDSYAKPSSHRITDPIVDDDDAELVKAISTGKTPAGTFVNGSFTNGGNYKVSIEEFENAVSENNNSQLKVSPYILDENGGYNHILGDTIFSGAPICITPEHHEIHCGDSYLCTRVVDVGGTAQDNLLIVVPNEVGSPQKLFHLVFEILIEAEGQIDFYEAPTYSNAGTPLTSRNKNRNSINNDVLAISHTPTITGVGTLIESDHYGSGKSVGGENRSDEWVLKNNTAYLLRFTNSVATANFITIKLKYYVHPGV